jgi:hypothetical protein
MNNPPVSETPEAPKPSSSSAETVDSLSRTLFAATWRFTLVSLGAFSLWAFSGRWFYRHVGEAGLYAATTVAFLGLAGVLLSRLVAAGPQRLWRFWRAFVPAFIVYAVCWCGFWFVLGSGAGEWLGSLTGSVAFVALMSRALGSTRALVWPSLVFFAVHSAGYFAGGWLMDWVLQSRDGGVLAGLPRTTTSVMAKLAWGAAYGVGFGLGLGCVCHTSQQRR